MTGKHCPAAVSCVRDRLWEDIVSAWAAFRDADCDCPESTVRLGGSWASRLGDVADLNDVQDIED